MSRGLGIEQKGILLAAAQQPDKWWGRMELQQAAWGIRRPEYKLRVPEGPKNRHWVKNVRWWRDDKALNEGNFNRALRSLQQRGLLERNRIRDRTWPDDKDAPPIDTWRDGRSWKITARGLAEAQTIRERPVMEPDLDCREARWGG